MEDHHIGVLIQNKRKEMGIGVHELARLAQVSASYIYAIESGKRGRHFDKLLRIANVLSMDIQELADIVNEKLTEITRKNSSFPLYHGEEGDFR